MAPLKQTDINTERKGPDKTTIESGFVIYDPDNPAFERLYLCKYLLELPDLEEGTGGDDQTKPDKPGGT